MFPFEDVTVTEGPGALTSASSAKSIPPTALATLVSAKRADQALKARLKLAAADPAVPVDLRSPYFEYEDVYLFDPAKKRRYPLLDGHRGRATRRRRTGDEHGRQELPARLGEGADPDEPHLPGAARRRDAASTWC